MHINTSLSPSGYVEYEAKEIIPFPAIGTFIEHELNNDEIVELSNMGEYKKLVNLHIPYLDELNLSSLEFYNDV